MSITSISFCFAFLPVALILYHVTGCRPAVLLLISLLFYAFGSPSCFLLLIVSMAVNYLLGYGMEKRKGTWKKPLLWIGILYNVGLLGFFKYAGQISGLLGKLLQTERALGNLALPMGLSFFTFKAISYLVDVYKGKVEDGTNPVYVSLYLSFFGQIQSGPLSRFGDMDFFGKKLTKAERADLFADGVNRFLNGFIKKILFANVLSRITIEIFAAAPDERSMAYAWLGALCYTMQLFFDFAGYSDMAIGITEMFGYRCPENFIYPYTTDSVAKFWRKWHITLGSWFRDYIYIPLGGSRVKSKGRLYLNLFAVWILTGIWHGSTWNFVVWGLGYFVLIAFEKGTGLPYNLKSKALKTCYRIAALLFINFQWVIFRADNLTEGLHFIKNMLVYSPNHLADLRTLFLLKDNWFFLLAGAFLCFPVVPWLDKKASANQTTDTIWQIFSMVLRIGLCIWAVSFVISGQNNPFAYANF